MVSIYTEIEINAPKDLVWQVLTNKSQWLYWNTFLFDSDPDRPLRQGEEVLLSLRRLPGEEEIEFQPLITLMQPAVCLRWFSAIPGLRNEYVFELQDIGAKRTKYIHYDRFSGVLRRLFLPFIRKDEHLGIKRMARELKYYVESIY